MDMPLLMVIHSPFYGVGDDTDNRPIKNERSNKECDATDNQRPSVNTIHVQVIESIGIYK